MSTNISPEDHKRNFKLLEAALADLKKLKLTQREQESYYQLQGHYMLEEGERLRSEGKTDASRIKYRLALGSYENFRRLRFKGLHALEFNLCNAARMLDLSDYALERCAASDRYAREGRLNFWQAKAIMGRIYSEKGDTAHAAPVFHEAWEIASRASAFEESRLKAFLAFDVKKWPALCAETPFSGDLAEVCAKGRSK